MDPAPPSCDAVAPDCPPWCVTSAAEHAYDDAGAWLHEGPRFGLVRTWCFDGAAPLFSATLDDGGGRPAAQAAADSPPKPISLPSGSR